MKIAWQIDPEDIAKVQDFFDRHQGTPFVRKRVETNLRDNKPPVTKPVFWGRMVGCLFTAQQRSGPDAAVSRFLLTTPCPLDYERSLSQEDLAEFARSVLANFGGLRRSTTIVKEQD